VSCKENKPISAKNELPENSKIVTIKLIDSLGVVTCSIPNRYDTFFSWTDHSDCGKPCSKEKYRYQSKLLKITKESGFVWLGEPKDSVERFTISHSGYFPFHKEANDSVGAVAGLGPFKGRLSSNPINPEVIFDTIENINGRYFSIIIMESYDSAAQRYIKKVSSLTSLYGNEIEFHYELNTKDTSANTKNFIANSLKLLRTIRLSKCI
jgi:hypothetical protein